MSIREDQVEQERTARQAAIKQALAADEPKTETPAEPAVAETFRGRKEDGSKAADLVAYDQSPDGTIHYRKLRAWESRDAKGRVYQHRPLSSCEREALDEEAFMESQRRQDEAHAVKVQEAVKERDRERRNMDKRREHEARTNKRRYNEGRFISLSEARARGFLQSFEDQASADNFASHSSPRRTKPSCPGREMRSSATKPHGEPGTRRISGT